MTKENYKPGDTVYFEYARGSGIEGRGEATVIRRTNKHRFNGYNYELAFRIDGHREDTILTVADFNLSRRDLVTLVSQ